jgi:putative FmdB family regulatory protein
MPTYDFKCKDCNENFTVQVSIKDKSKVTCTKCGSREIEQKFRRINVGGISAGNSGSSCSGGSCSSCPGCH